MPVRHSIKHSLRIQEIDSANLLTTNNLIVNTRIRVILINLNQFLLIASWYMLQSVQGPAPHQFFYQ